VTSVLVLYHSQEFGNTDKMARAVAEGAEAAGAQVTLYNADEGRFDVEQYRTFDAVAFGTPDYYSYIAGTLKTFLDDWFIAKNNDAARMLDKPIALFYSHGGGGAVRRPFEHLFGRMGPQVGQTVESLGEPSERILAACCELGQRLVEEAEHLR
jgi:flavorubredoxin